MKNQVYLVAAFLALLCTVGSKPTPETDEDNYGPLLDEDGENAQNDNPPEYYDEKDEKVVENNPEKPDDYYPVDDKRPLVISTVGKTYYPLENETVTLPCEISGGEYVQIWRKNSMVLFQSGINLAAPANMAQNPNGSLTISNIQKQDEGAYQCMAMVTTANSPSITHTVKLKTSPNITFLMAKDNITVLKTDDTLVLTCKASGRPKPHISWHKGSERLVTEGETLTITNIKHRDAGVYRCLADNGVGHPAHGEINMKVELKPIVNIEKLAVNSDSNFDTELKCIVHAEPRALVVWKKEENNIVNSPHTQLINKGHNHMLVIKGLQESDFGNYSCSATNYLGTTVKSIRLVKTPAILKFVKPSVEDKEVVLTWEVQSKSPISQHEIEYRKKGSNSWQQVHPEVSQASAGDVYTVKYKLKGLEPGQYEARIRSQNTHGWSDFSDEMVFEGVYAKHGHHNKHKKGHNKDVKEKHMTPPVVEDTKANATQEQQQQQQPHQNEAPPPAEHQSVGTEQPVGAVSKPSGCSSVSASSTVPLLIISIVSMLYLHNHKS